MPHGLDGLDLDGTIQRADQIARRGCQRRGIPARAQHQAGASRASTVGQVKDVRRFLAEAEVNGVRDHANDPQRRPGDSFRLCECMPDRVLSREIVLCHRAANYGDARRLDGRVLRRKIALCQQGSPHGLEVSRRNEAAVVWL
jgi:hypothetical protein